jgi:hypothetical protein
LQVLDSVSAPACQELSSTHTNLFCAAQFHNIHYPQYNQLPHPFDIFLTKATTTVPWRVYFHSHSLFPLTLDHSASAGAYLHASLACFDPDTLSMAHGEFIGMALIQEDILQASNLAMSESPLDVR